MRRDTDGMILATEFRCFGAVGCHELPCIGQRRADGPVLRLGGDEGEGGPKGLYCVHPHLFLARIYDRAEIEGIDINPLMVLEEGAVAEDARIALRSIPMG